MAVAPIHYEACLIVTLIKLPSFGLVWGWSHRSKSFQSWNSPAPTDLREMKLKMWLLWKCETSQQIDYNGNGNWTYKLKNAESFHNTVGNKCFFVHFGSVYTLYSDNWIAQDVCLNLYKIFAHIFEVYHKNPHNVFFF